MARQADGYFEHLEQYEGPDTPFKPGTFKADTMTCAHCMTVVLLQPLRQRERGWCWKGDHYLCDNCWTLYGRIGECFTEARTIDLIMANPESGVSLGRPATGMPTPQELRLIEDTKVYPHGHVGPAP